jgi:purine-binding chemotaxis protein CheW
MNNARHYLIFSLDDQRYALPLSAVERVVRVVELVPMPKAPNAILGVVNIQGRIIPVISVRRQFGFTEREPDLTDQLIITSVESRATALLVDSVLGVVESSSDRVVPSSVVSPELNEVNGLMNLEGRTVMIQNLDALGQIGNYTSEFESERWNA